MCKQIAIVFLLLANAQVAYAVSVSWNLEAAFDGPYGAGSFTGSFDYDADINEFSNLTFSATNIPFNPISPFQVDEGDADYLTTTASECCLDPYGNLGQILIDLYFESPLTNSGGIIPLLVSSTWPLPNGYSGFCEPPGCISFTSGTVSAVPIPPSIWLLGSALSFVGWMRRRQG